jgi:hypothetical protein
MPHAPCSKYNLILHLTYKDASHQYQNYVTITEVILMVCGESAHLPQSCLKPQNYNNRPKGIIKFGTR